MGKERRRAFEFGERMLRRERSHSESLAHELPGCCDLEVPHFRVALCGRYGKDQPRQRATRALNTGLARKRGRKERALKATTLGELMATFGTDGSLDEFKRLIEELNCDLGEFVEFIVTRARRARPALMVLYGFLLPKTCFSTRFLSPLSKLPRNEEMHLLPLASK
eukprot:1140480-Pleurochrysis_carterae.AAC.1